MDGTKTAQSPEKYLELIKEQSIRLFIQNSRDGARSTLS